MRKWECVVCGFQYDEANGMPEHDIASGTRWEDVHYTFPFAHIVLFDK